MTTAERLARLDSRPAHPEDYEEEANKLLAELGNEVLTRRLVFLEQPGNAKLVGGYLALVNALRTGVLRDEYSAEVLAKCD